MSAQQLTKQCSKCETSKLIEEFPAHPTGRDGRSTYCKKCHSVQTKARYERNRERRMKQIRDYNDANPEIIKRAQSAWRERHPHRASEITRKWQRKNQDYVRQNASRRRAVIRGASVGDPRDVTRFYKFVMTAGKIRCYWCGEFVSKKNRQIDHIVPLARGGTHEVSNLCCSCANCNHRKSSKLPSEFVAQQEMFLQPTSTF